MTLIQEEKVISFLQKKKGLSAVLQTVLALMLVALFLSSSVFLVLAFRPLYYFDVDHLNIPEESGFSRERVIENYDALIDYNLPLGDGDLVFPSLAMSAHGKQHFEEVKDIFDAFKITALVLLPLCVFGVIVFAKAKERIYLLIAAVSGVALPLLTGALVALNWESAFVRFHELFFDNDYWIFNARTDPVITILPEDFFMHCAIAIISLVLLESAICFVVWMIKRRKRASV